MNYLVYLVFSDDDKNVKSQLKVLTKHINLNFQSTVIVNNKKNDSSIGILHGDNSSRDMSGYEKGLIYLFEKFHLKKTDKILFANDTIFSKHSARAVIALFNYTISELDLDGKHMIGWRDRQNKLRYNSIRGPQREWVSTYFFMAPAVFLERTRIRPEYLSPESLFNIHDINNFFRREVSVELRDYLVKSIMTRGQGWINSQDLSDINKVSLAGKASAILCETELAYQAQINGVEIVAINEDLGLRESVIFAFNMFVEKLKEIRSTPPNEKLYRIKIIIKKLLGKFFEK